MLTTVEITLSGVIFVGGLVWTLVQLKMSNKMKELDDLSEVKMLKEVDNKIATSKDIILSRLGSDHNEMEELKADFKTHKDKTETKFEELLKEVNESNRTQTQILGDIRTDIEVLKNK